MILELNDAKPILAQLLLENNLTIFAGSGMSIDSGVPDWDGLLQNFMDMASNLPGINENDKKDLDKIISDAKESQTQNRFDPIKVATVLKNKLNEINFEEYALARADYRSWVSKTFIDKIANNKHLSIVQTDYPFIITSNYDLLFERAALTSGYGELSSRTFAFFDELKIMSAIHQNKPCIIHVHGSASDLSIDKLIFTKEDYNKIILKKYNGFSFALKMLFTRYSTLFVGYGASDPHLEEVFEEISEFFPVDRNKQYPLPEAYLVTLRSKANTILDRWKDRVRTNLIIIDNYKQYDLILEHLKNAKPR